MVSKGALAGCKVIDLSRILGGPYCTQILGDHGAEVLKIEPPAGDDTRTWGPPFLGDTASYFVGVNRNKTGLTLDLSSEKGRHFLRDLLKDADVLVENFKPGTLEKWGIGYDTLSQQFPHLIHCRVSGFGEDGPLGKLPGYDACAQAMCGLMSVNGMPDQDPTRVGLPVVDMVTGLNATIAILMAIHERSRSGIGQFLDITLYDCAISLLHPHAANYFYSGRIPERTGNAHPNIAPYETVSTGDGELFLAVGNNRQFEILCRVLDMSELLADTRFKDNPSRVEHRAALHLILKDRLQSEQATALSERLLQMGVPAAAVQSIDAVLNHPHTQHRQMVWQEGDYIGVGTPIKLSRTPARLRLHPPELQKQSPKD